jgi:hypothetical protein
MRRERESSRMAFHDLTAVGAERLMMSDYGTLLTEAGSNPAAAVARVGRLIRYVGSNRAIVRSAHGLRVVDSTAPLRVAGPHGLRPVDLKLGESGDVFAPARPAADVSIGADLALGVALGGGLRITLEGADVAGRLASGNSVFFPDAATDTDASVAPTATGAELFAVLRSRLSPEQLRYRVSLPSGDVLYTARGGARVVRDGKTVAQVLPPNAQDA